MSTSKSSGFVLTGKHVLAILLAYFGTVIAVNMYMATAAVRTFSGVEAEKPYQEGLKYDNEIASAREQAKRGWTVDASVRPREGGAVIDVTQKDAAGLVTPGLAFKAVFMHPADRRRDVKVDLAKVDAGHYSAPVAVAPGRWDVLIEASDGKGVLFRSVNRVDLTR